MSTYVRGVKMLNCVARILASSLSHSSSSVCKRLFLFFFFFFIQIVYLCAQICSFCSMCVCVWHKSNRNWDNKNTRNVLENETTCDSKKKNILKKRRQHTSDAQNYRQNKITKNCNLLRCVYVRLPQYCHRMPFLFIYSLPLFLCLCVAECVCARARERKGVFISYLGKIEKLCAI